MSNVLLLTTTHGCTTIGQPAKTFIRSCCILTTIQIYAEHNIWNSMNERIHFFIKIYLSHFILERVMFFVCERWVETRTGCYFDPSSSDHSSTSSSSWLGMLNHGSLMAQSPLSAAGSHTGILTPTNSNHLGHLVILLSYVHLLPLFFRLFTQVHLLIDGSVEGQYITFWAGIESRLEDLPRAMGDWDR